MSTLQTLADQLRAAAEARTPVVIEAGGSKRFYGLPSRGQRIDPRPHAGIVAYEPTELTVIARCGTRLVDLEETLAEQRQCLAFEPPHFGGGATVGGMVAAGLSGPRRIQCGPLRDYVLGARLLDSAGRELRFGAAVMKNVAGYDVPRLLAGSLGTLGLVTEVTLKVLPLPQEQASLRLACTQAEALARLARWSAAALPLSASAWHLQDGAGVLDLRLSGAAAAVAAAVRAIGGEAMAEPAASAFWQTLRDQTHPFFGGDAPLWRLALPAQVPPLALPGDTLLEWHGQQRWLRGTAEPAAIRAAAAAAGGHATLFRAPDALRQSAGVFAPQPAAQLELHRRVKQGFDPHGLCNRGRLYPEL